MFVYVCVWNVAEEDDDNIFEGLNDEDEDDEVLDLTGMIALTTTTRDDDELRDMVANLYQVCVCQLCFCCAWLSLVEA